MYELIKTEDGSLTSKDTETGELYHNRAGAYTEALLNYVLPSAALKKLNANGHLRILDICFGLGYNSLVLLERAISQKLTGTIEIIAIERDRKIVDCLPQVLDDERLSVLGQGLNTASSDSQTGREFRFIENGLDVSLHIFFNDLRLVVPELKDDFDFVFHDPFSAKHVPELWTVEIFKHYQRLLKVRDGAVLTYSCATAVRGGMKSAGFNILRTVAVGNKNGGTFASISNPLELPEHVFPLTDEELEKLAGRSSLPYSDTTMAASRVDVVKRRQSLLDASASKPTADSSTIDSRKD